MAPAARPDTQATDFSQFTDDQLAMLLNVAGQARWLAVEELARRHPLATNPPADPPPPAE